MRRRTFTAGALSALFLAPAGQALAGGNDAGLEEPPASGGPVVVADGLDNPRQLSWAEPGDRLLVAEAGRGAATAEECTTPPPPAGPPQPVPSGEPEPPEEPVDPVCVGPTAGITEIDLDDHGGGAEVEQVVEGLLSVAAPNGAFAVGANGVDALAGETAVYLVAQSPGLAFADSFKEGNNEQGLYLVADADRLEELPPQDEEIPDLVVLPGGDFAFLGANLYEAEARLNPDTGQVESNPYAVVFVEEDPAVEEDGYALVADAAANTVWKVMPPEDEEEAGPTDLLVEVFVAYPTTGGPDGQDDPAGPTEFVPTSLALTPDGHVVVGGLGSEREGEAQVVEYDLATGEEVRRFTGFTGVTGVAVDDTHVYVSQLFGDTLPEPPGDSPDDEVPPALTEAPGSIVKVSRSDPDAPRSEFPAPLPAGLAADASGGVYAAVNSIAPAEGVQDLFGPDSLDLDGGQVWHVGADLFDEEPQFQWPPADTAGEFVEFPDEFLPVRETELCGSTVTIFPGDVREVEYRSTVAGGTTIVELRGRTTVDIRRESDNAFIDELDVSGAGTEVYAPGGTVVFSYDGPSIVYAFDDVEAAEFEQEGLPRGFYYASGRLTETVVFPALETPPGPDQPAPPVQFAAITENTTEGVRDLCAMLDEAGPGGEEPVQPGRVESVDTAADRVTLASGAAVVYDANDQFTVNGEPATLEQFEAALVAGMVLTGVQALDPAESSRLDVSGTVAPPDEPDGGPEEPEQPEEPEADETRT